MNRYICTYPERVRDELEFSFSNRWDATADDIERAVNSRVCDLLHDYDDDALVQVCEAVCINSEWLLDEPNDFIEDVPGAEAVREIREAIEGGAYPLFVSGEVMGHYTIASGGVFAYIYTDCDELSYSEYYAPENYGERSWKLDRVHMFNY